MMDLCFVYLQTLELSPFDNVPAICIYRCAVLKLLSRFSAMWPFSPINDV